jgi:hypothetical protein
MICARPDSCCVDVGCRANTRSALRCASVIDKVRTGQAITTTIHDRRRYTPLYIVF